MPAQSGNRADSNLVAANIKNGVTIFGILGTYSPSVTGGASVVQSYLPVGIVYDSGIIGNSAGALVFNSTIYTYDDGTYVYGVCARRYQNSGQSNVILVVKINKTTGVVVQYQSAFTPGPTTSGGSKINMTIQYVRFGTNEIGIVYNSGDGLVIFNTLSNTFTTNTYTRLSADKSFAGTDFSDDTVNYNIFTGSYKLKFLEYTPHGTCYHYQRIIVA